jgi:flagellar secretion chaperone FliS
MIAGRTAYMGSMVNTASPAQLLVLLYDRLVLDLQRAIEAQALDEHLAAGPHLLHAQEIVLELQSSLRLDAWDGAARLSGIYSWLHRELVRANVQRDVAATRSCLGLVTPLADAWREAALTPADR